MAWAWSSERASVAGTSVELVELLAPFVPLLPSLVRALLLDRVLLLATATSTCSGPVMDGYPFAVMDGYPFARAPRRVPGAEIPVTCQHGAMANTTDGGRPVVWDADAHICEPPAVWQEYADPEFRDLVLQVRTHADGRETLFAGGVDTATNAAPACIPGAY